MKNREERATTRWTPIINYVIVLPLLSFYNFIVMVICIIWIITWANISRGHFGNSFIAAALTKNTISNVPMQLFIYFLVWHQIQLHKECFHSWPSACFAYQTKLWKWNLLFIQFSLLSCQRKPLVQFFRSITSKKLVP